MVVEWRFEIKSASLTAKCTLTFSPEQNNADGDRMKYYKKIFKEIFLAGGTAARRCKMEGRQKAT